MTAIENNSKSHTAHTNWYRQPMVWMIICIPLSAVIMGAVMLFLSISSFDGLVADDYYKKGKEINRVLERDSYASAYHLSATVTIDSGGEVLAELTYEPGLVRPDQIALKLLHRTRSGLDQTVTLDAYGDKHYRGTIEPLAASRWLVQLETETWRINGQATLPGNNTVRLTSQ
ncbi:MAG: FixH family protein [bacterium]